MCIDAMATEERKQREGRAGRWRRRRKSVYAGVVKAGVRKYAGKSPRKPGRRCHSLAWEKQNQADALPEGAMAPRNTTQYLMELVYSDMNITAPSSRRRNCLPPQHEHIYSYTSLYTHEDTMDFQHRDFESVFFRNEL
ncbi:hypothetical protein PHYPO_G00085720 [Pangasianodon hypophthalmus]|uniref:Uncharacterized protein n=1 Tax=Pangasianodon hypophthalmus TaxID=310915 RepID=A0A5N5LGN2_PANHP|nr:hypothetical protein PHYPO_G00085720 [Pangasianodon hypophthalmus]